MASPRSPPAALSGSSIAETRLDFKGNPHTPWRPIPASGIIPGSGRSLKLKAVETLDRLTGRRTAGDLARNLEAAEEAADNLGMEWEEWLSSHLRTLRWDRTRSRFTE